MAEKFKTQYDYMRQADSMEEDAMYPEEWNDESNKTSKEKYFEFYDDIKTTPKDDW